MGRPLMLAPEHIDAVTTLLAKSGADVGAFFTQYAKNLQPLQFEWSDLPEDITLAPPDLPFLREGPTIELKRPNAPGIPGLPDFDPPSVPSEYAQYIPLLICPVFAGFFVLLGNSGILGAGAGLFFKTLLDLWNVFANLALKG